MARNEHIMLRKVGTMIRVRREKLSKKHRVTTETMACGMTIKSDVVVALFALHPMFSNT